MYLDIVNGYMIENRASIDKKRVHYARCRDLNSYNLPYEPSIAKSAK